MNLFNLMYFALFTLYAIHAPHVPASVNYGTRPAGALLGSAPASRRCTCGLRRLADRAP